MTGIGSAASVLLGYLAAGTQSIRLGSGGVMLPNHAPLVIAEQFGTLESLYPGRIDLGLGRAPGTDQRTMMALRRHLSGNVDTFPRDVQELQNYFCDAQPGQPVQAVPGQGLHVPLWLLGSSLYSAQLAAQLGLPFAFASHFAPDMLFQALQLYRENFKPSNSWRSRTPWCASTSSPPTAIATRASCSVRCSSSSSICAAVRPARCRRRWITSTRCGPPASNMASSRRCGCRSSAMKNGAPRAANAAA